MKANTANATIKWQKIKFFERTKMAVKIRLKEFNCALKLKNVFSVINSAGLCVHLGGEKSDLLNQLNRFLL